MLASLNKHGKLAITRKSALTSVVMIQLVLLPTTSMALFFSILIFNSLLGATTSYDLFPSVAEDANISRSSFPPDFIFGTASSAYQYEGEARGDGKGPSMWDYFTHKYPGRIADGSNGDVAIDFYHRYKEDVNIMKEMGLDAFRLSISWSRILPSGKLSGGVNEEGIDFYNNLINELLRNGIQPFVTIFHWDVPQALEEEYGGFLSPNIVRDFRDFAEVCFREFGDRVKHWITLNEPMTYSSTGYDTGANAPGRCSSWVSEACQAGNSATEPYIVGHHLILSHSAAATLYKQKYQESQSGSIGVTLNCAWMIPYSNTTSDSEAVLRALDFMFGWYMDPLTHGEYPLSMRALVGERLPNFTEIESEMVKGSFDFIGINYYTTYYVYDVPFRNLVNISYSTDSLADLTGVRNGVPIGPQDGTGYLYVYPKGFRDLLMYIKEKYNNPVIYITENGIDELNNNTLPLSEALKDPQRIYYHAEHLTFLLRAIHQGAKVKGYFAWSLLDNFEWNVGYTIRFGINFVDYNDGLRRYPKSSAAWFKRFLSKASAIFDS